MLNAAVTVRMREAGGRAVERSLDIGIRPQSSMIGIRPDFAGSEVPQGGTASFSVIAADPEGRRVALPGALWKLVRIDRNYQWYRANGYWNYEPVTFTTAVAGGTIDIPASGEASISQTVDWGRYRLEIETPDPAGPATSHEFDAGWYVAASSTETPDGLEIALDKEEYAPGEVARLKISPRFAGELLVTIGADRLLATVSATVPEAGTTVEIPVGAEWGAGRLCHRNALPSRRIDRDADAGPGNRREMAADRPGRKEAGGCPRRPRPIGAAPDAARSGHGGRRRSRQRRLCHGRSGRRSASLNLTRYEAPDPEHGSSASAGSGWSCATSTGC